MCISGTAQHGCVLAAQASTTKPRDMLRRSANRDATTWLCNKPVYMTCAQMYFCTPSYWKSSATETHSLVQTSFN